mmetsp:Transcript_37395/g.60893  ORF Transcript_37395/g.60893 Transcript_37395/m.60893 type:complete len:95 (+) Transcript_37395:1366-1650(+)
MAYAVTSVRVRNPLHCACIMRQHPLKLFLGGFLLKAAYLLWCVYEPGIIYNCNIATAGPPVHLLSKAQCNTSGHQEHVGPLWRPRAAATSIQAL